MEFSAGNLLLIAIVCAIIGYVAGIVVTNMGREKNDLESRLQSVEIAELTAAEGAETPNETSRLETPRMEAARLVRDEPHSPLKVILGGKVYPRAADMTSLQRGELEEVTVELLSWLGYNPAQRSQPAPEPVVKAAEPVLLTHSPEKIKLTPLPVAPVPKDQPKSMVGQINDILQEKVVGTEFENQGVQLLESPIHGVMVQVGLDTYNAIEEVPVEEIKKLIRASVTLWEKRSK